MRMLMAFVLALAIAGCDFLSDDEKGPPSLVGEWNSKDTVVYTVEDSLYRVGLNAYMLERGVDLEKYFDTSDSVYLAGKSLEEIVQLMGGFSYTCAAPEPCKKVLQTSYHKSIFSRDSVRELFFLNDTMDTAFAWKYRRDEDSIYYIFTLPDSLSDPLHGSEFEISRKYEFIGSDTLIVHFVLDDTLIRVP